MLHHQIILAAAATDPVGWIKSHLVPLAITIVGVIILFGAHGRNYAKAVGGVGILLIGLMVIAMASGTTATDVGSSFANMVSNWVQS